MIRSWTIRILLIVLIAFVAVPAGTANLANAQVLKGHSPISISQNSDFTAANGVTSGDGTSSNPYIIQGWSIIGQCTEHPCSSSPFGIQNTTAYFIVRNVALAAAGIGTGLVLYRVVHGQISDSGISGDERALEIFSSKLVTISSDTFGGGRGIYVENSTDIIVSKNKFMSGTVIDFIHSARLTITDNVATGADGGIFLSYSKTVTVARNSLNNISFTGIGAFSSSDLTIVQNNISASGLLYIIPGLPDPADHSGIGLVNTTASRIYHNNLVANNIQAYDNMGSGNVWDDGYPSGGNYLSDYSGKDNCTGPIQNICGRPDGIGDTPYTFDSNKDRYPLVHPYAAAIKVPVKLQHDVIKLGHDGKYLKVFVQLPRGVKIVNIVASSIRLNNTLVLALGTIPTFEKVKGVTMMVLSFTGINSLVSRPGRYTLEVTGNILTATTFAQFYGFTSIHFVHSSHSRDDSDDQHGFSFTDNFNYASITALQSAGWTLCGGGVPSTYYRVDNGLLTLTSDGIVTGAVCYSKIPTGIQDWTVSARGEWIGQSYGTIRFTVRTTSHYYDWSADGYYNQFILLRDNVIVFRLDGYKPQLNVFHTLRLDKTKGVLTFFFDGRQIGSYQETDPVTTLATVMVGGGWIAIDSWDYVTIAHKTGK